MKADFNNSIFVNCPFDKAFEPILQAILFCVKYNGLAPRLASERSDSAENRIDKIVELIEACRFSIHDLSRCQAARKGEMFRLNMPLELGIDYGSRKFGHEPLPSKRILILEKEQYRIQKALSDLAGCDIKSHGENYEKAIRQVRNWLIDEAVGNREPAQKVIGAYIAFQEWHYERQMAAGFSEEDIQEYPTSELLAAMDDWIGAGKPASWK